MEALAAQVHTGLQAIADLPDRIRAAHPEGTTAAEKFTPVAMRATVLMGRPAAELSPEWIFDAGKVYREAVGLSQHWYRWMGGEHHRLMQIASGAHVSGHVVGIAPAAAAVAAAALARVASVLRSAWPFIRNGAVTLMKWMGRNPVKTTAGVAAAGGIQGIWRAGENLGMAAEAAAGGVMTVAKAGSGLGGFALILLALAFMHRR